MQGLRGTRGIGNGDENLHVLSAYNGTLQLLGDFDVPEAREIVRRGMLWASK